MRQAIMFEPADLALLHRGKTLTVQLPNGQPFDLVGPMNGNGARPPTVEAPEAKPKKKKKKGPVRGQMVRDDGHPRDQGPEYTLRGQRGTCPYCHKTDLMLASHVRHQHPEQPVQWFGAGGINCERCKPPRRFPTPRSLRFHVGHVHPKGAKT